MVFMLVDILPIDKGNGVALESCEYFYHVQPPVINTMRPSVSRRHCIQG